MRDWIALQDSARMPTPVYLYDLDVMRARLAILNSMFGAQFDVSYAIKANPNAAIVKTAADSGQNLDASSYAEVVRARKTGIDPAKISFSGPGKRLTELELFIGTGSELVVESFEEIADAARIASTKGITQNVLIRVNPDFVPRGFGASMSGKPSQFGIDEQSAADAVAAIDAAPNLSLVGLHIYTGSNSLSADTIVENFENMARLFTELADGGSRKLEKLIFGAGFGVPYHNGQTPLDLEKVAAGTLHIAKLLRSYAGFADTTFILELGRWVVGPAGALLTSVLSTKISRGQNIRICDAGFNNHLAACGMMGSVFRKDWPVAHLTAEANSIEESVKLTGPLCTSIDALAGPLNLPFVKRGDVLAVLLSGAYGLTASPSRFISHPEPFEIIIEDGEFRDVTESHHNHIHGHGNA
ncbi:alanine racemase [Loktanella sp. SALINAS62]|uniref:alanine racemase n=1 Tax=Loktanella sp. SALINAS62 TaxID=2706124 RepID=UPI001B8B274E|nr:alanine racemase [Loktanella sp. SALINAS62]MBS1301530.1 type III PLP-dependent enzyme [Loktanella sp. SALINAS62]